MAEGFSTMIREMLLSEHSARPSPSDLAAHFEHYRQLIDIDAGSPIRHGLWSQHEFVQDHSTIKNFPVRSSGEEHVEVCVPCYRKWLRPTPVLLLFQPPPVLLQVLR